MKKYLSLIVLSILYAGICLGAELLCCTLGEEAACCATIGRKWCPKEGECRTKCLDELCPKGYVFDASLMKCKKIEQEIETESETETEIGTTESDTGITETESENDCPNPKCRNKDGVCCDSCPETCLNSQQLRNDNGCYVCSSYARQVEYIQSTGTQYIDTGVYPHSDKIVYELAWLQTAYENDKVIFGGVISSPALHRNCLATINERTYLDMGTSDHLLSSVPVTVNSLNTVKIILNNGSLTEIHNGIEYNATYNGFVQSELTIPLFAYHSNKGYSYFTEFTRLYYWKMTDDDSLVRDFIPVVDWDGVACLYDKVSGELFYNQGTGSFLVP